MQRTSAFRSPIVSVVYYGHMAVRSAMSEPAKQELDSVVREATWDDFEADAWDPSLLDGDSAL